ncbi:pilus assembly FimT family protein [Sulfurimonas sp.]|uniref:pilus assembly FimT family protein n=1 Tax=Sulfurimonas sp. TaxID=2022749 RepID=UPI003D0C67B4
MKKAFTMLELIFVLIVAGILAALIMPRMERNPTYEAGVQLLSHIRYAQHLAMINDQYDTGDNQWYLERWQVYFPVGGQTYTVYSDTDHNGQVDQVGTYTSVEAAINPTTKNTYLIGSANGTFTDTNRLSKELNLNTKYGITTIHVNGGAVGTNARRIIFDNLGRLYQGTTNAGDPGVIVSPTDSVATGAMFVKLCSEDAVCNNNDTPANSDNEVVIRIDNETGYACLLQQGSNVNCLD